jgi:lysophospholipase L1-like esterase
MLLSLPGLAARGFDANAHGCRQFSEALALLSQLRAQHRLPHLVAIALGANGAITPSDIDAARRLLCCGRLLVLVTPRQLGGASGANAVLEHEEAKAHPGSILLLDWVKVSAGHPDWFQPDRLHLTFPGVHAFNDLLSSVLPFAYVPCPPGSAAAADSIFSSSPVAPLTLTATLAHVGYVGVTLTGPAGVSVQLSEQLPYGLKPIQTVVLGASGAQLPDALAWNCDQRTRALVASTLPPAPPQQANVSVMTPGCSGRIRARIERTARSGTNAAVAVADRWGTGGVAVTICTSPPGGVQACAPRQLRPGQSRRVVRIPVPRPGGWRITVTTRYGYRRSGVAWARHPSGRLRLLAVGDSEMQILDDFIAQDLAPHRVSVISDARISTGLTSPFVFNWEAHARRQASALRPDVTVMFIGANDGFGVSGPSHHPVTCCNSSWSAGYADLVAEMMRSYLRGKAGRVYWFVLPTPRPGNFRSLFDAVNSGVRRAARRFPGRVATIDANAFFTPHDRYRDYMTYHGHGFVIHEPDGIHLSAASDVVAARLLVRRMIADRVIR